MTDSLENTLLFRGLNDKTNHIENLSNKCRGQEWKDTRFIFKTTQANHTFPSIRMNLQLHHGYCIQKTATNSNPKPLSEGLL